MNVPDCAPCDVKHLTPIATILLSCAFGVLGLAAAVLGLKIWEATGTRRERRLNASFRRRI
jgi:hypothetical protein